MMCVTSEVRTANIYQFITTMAALLGMKINYIDAVKLINNMQ
jgi:hypothetical protein